MSHQESPHDEQYYLLMEFIPILLAWILGIISVFLFVFLPFLTRYCCRCDQCESDEHTCDTCHCKSCGRLKCMNNAEECECQQCIDSNVYKQCHSMPGCEKCRCRPLWLGSLHENASNTVYEYNICQHFRDYIAAKCCKFPCDSDCITSMHSRCSSGYFHIKDYITSMHSHCSHCCSSIKDYSTSMCLSGCCRIKDSIARCLCGFSFRCLCSCVARCCCLTFEVNRLLKAGNLLTRVFYGGSLGPLREGKKLQNNTYRGREVFYINDLPILEEAFILHLALTFKSILLLVFCSSTFFDLLLVSSDYSCDTSKNCYVFDSNYAERPTQNCSELLANSSVDIVCYSLVFDYKKASGYAGGLYTVSRFTVTIVANVCIWIYTQCKNRKRIFWFLVGLQYSSGVCFIGVCVGLEYWFLYVYNADSVGPLLSQVTSWFKSLSVVLTIALSIFAPWHHAVTRQSKVHYFLCSCAKQTQNNQEEEEHIPECDPLNPTHSSNSYGTYI